MDSQPDSPPPDGTSQEDCETSEVRAPTVPDRRSARTLANRAFVAVKAQHAKDRGPVERFAQQLNDIASSTPFLVIHVIWFLIWIPWNVGLLGLKAFDPYPFGLLTMVVSLEAIFLSIFVLLAQKREAAIAELREEIGLQVGLWTEQEVTKTLQLVTGLYRRLGHPIADDPELREMLRPLDVKGIENRLVKQIEQTQRAKTPKGVQKQAE